MNRNSCPRALLYLLLLFSTKSWLDSRTNDYFLIQHNGRYFISVVVTLSGIELKNINEVSEVLRKNNYAIKFSNLTFGALSIYQQLIKIFYAIRKLLHFLTTQMFYARSKLLYFGINCCILVEYKQHTFLYKLYK